MSALKTIPQAKYRLNTDGSFVIENYNQSKPFSNFFPGIAGVWGIPMWVFYVNRGQCIASFGIEAKDKAIMEFQPANKSYRLTSLQGFRTFIKLTSGSKTIYWEPFQNHLEGTGFKKKQTLTISAHDLTLQEINLDLGLTATVNYFTLPEEPYASLVRSITIKNTGRKSYRAEIIDGLPALVPYGLTDVLNKNIARTAEAWVQVRNLSKKAPYYQLRVEVSDTPRVTHIEEGNFFFSFDPKSKNRALLDPIIENTHIFGDACDFLAPVKFRQGSFKVPKRQQASNRTPSAMGYTRFLLKPKGEKNIVSLFGHAHSETQLNKIVRQVTQRNFIEKKAECNKTIIDEIKNFALTESSSKEFNLYSSYTFLDNILRGGLPVSLQTNRGPIAINVYSRKHGDLERDYNYFVLAPTFYSQGNGNYRDVNQNRRNDVWFNADVKSSHLVNFLNLSQADGYNPLIIRGTAFSVYDKKKLNRAIARCVAKNKQKLIKEFVQVSFMPGDLLTFITQKRIQLKVDPKIFLAKILETCHREELADHGEGFWSDHWTYNLDLIDSYFSVYPENLKSLLFDKKLFNFYHNTHYVLPREQRYILTDHGVRQYASVANGAVIDGNLLKTKGGKGKVYTTNLACKILCLVANKVASLDPSGIGIEMEADKPNWYDSLNGLPGLLGSSISETFELKRYSIFLDEAIEQLGLSEEQNIPVFKELADFILGLTRTLSSVPKAQAYWRESNDQKEAYRKSIRAGINGKEINITVSQVKKFLDLVIKRTDKGIQSAKNTKGFLATYFYHDVVKFKPLRNNSKMGEQYVEPIVFKKHVLPLFLEGYVHALRIENDPTKARKLYNQVRKSDLFDKKLKMYKVSTNLSSESEEIGRARIFPSGWLENESIWLHMEYKFILELLRCELYEEFYANFRFVLIPFLKPAQYGRSVLENSSFLVSSAHEDIDLHGQGFIARLSGSTAEFVHIWLMMNIGKNPFTLNDRGELVFTFKPALAGWLFTLKKSTVSYWNQNKKCRNIMLPKNIYAFNLFGSTLVVYHNPRRKNTFGKNKSSVKEMHLVYPDKKMVIVNSESLSGPYAQDVRDRKIKRIDVFLK